MESQNDTPNLWENKADTGSSWWLQPIWKALVKIGSFPQVGVKIKNIGNHHLKDGWFGYYISNFGEDPSELP